jgi:hypothetical protein
MATEITVISQTVRDAPKSKEGIGSARFIGYSNRDQNSILVSGALDATKDVNDVYKFRVSGGGPLSFNSSVTSTTRFELLDRNGKVIADSAGGNDGTRQAYQALISGQLQVTDGDYYVRVSRTAIEGSDKDVGYSFNIRNGDYTTQSVISETTAPSDNSASSVEVLSKVTTDAVRDRLFTSRFIGRLVTDQTRLVVNSALTLRGDNVDVYRFLLENNSSPVLELGDKTTEGLNIELVAQSGRVLASNRGAADLKDNFAALQKGELQLDKADAYYIRVSRPQSVGANDQVKYNFTLQDGDYYKEFRTQEKPAPAEFRNNTKASTFKTQLVGSIVSAAAKVSLLGEDNIFSKLYAAPSDTVADDLFKTLDGFTSNIGKVDIKI